MYGDSQAFYSDDDPIFPLGPNAKEASFQKSRELFMDSGADTTYSTNNIEYTKLYGIVNQHSSGLLKYRSAPSSLLLESFADGVGVGGRNRGENPGLTSRFGSNGGHGNSTYGVNSQLPPQYPSSSKGTAQMESVNGGYRIPSSVGVVHQGEYKIGSNLVRQNSSPAELFSHLSTPSGYTKMRAARRYRPENDDDDATDQHLCPSSNIPKVTMNFSPGIHSTLGMLSRISEIENETGGADDGKLGTGDGDGDNNQFYGSGFPFGSWNNPSKFAENFTGLKREIDTDHNLFSDSQGGEPRNQPNMLSHYLSLPKTSAEIAAMEKLFQFSDSVPCKIRAKRGCATHPRSIAERVRRTRISERMRKLQELVPNMDKQTNTAGMLDLAVDYIKELQKQYKTLSDIRANCKCSATKQTGPDQMI